VDSAEQAAALEAFAKPLVDGILPIISVTQEFAGVPAEIYGARDHPSYAKNWRFVTSNGQPWLDLHQGTGMLVSEQLARKSGLSLGDEVNIEGRAFNLVGIHSDYGNPNGQVILGEAAFVALFPEAYPHRFGLQLDPAKAEAVQISLRDDFGLPAANIRDQAAMKAFSLAIFDRTFTVTAALNVLTLAVAGFAILMSLLTLAAMRLPQLAPVWALGMTRTSLGWFEMLRALMLALLTTLLAIPLGLALAWVLLSVVNVEAFGWRLPMFFFPLSYLQLTLFALGAAVLAALWPARHLARRPPSALLAVFIHER